MKTFKQFCEDAASEYIAGRAAYSRSLEGRREIARQRSRSSVSSFKQRSLAAAQSQKEKQLRGREKIQAVQRISQQRSQEAAQRRAAARAGK